METAAEAAGVPNGVQHSFATASSTDDRPPARTLSIRSFPVLASSSLTIRLEQK